MKIILAAVLLTGCSGASGGSADPEPRTATPEAWSAALCGGLDALITAQKALSASYSAQATKIVSQPAVSRMVLVRAMDAVRGDFTASAVALEAAGPPDVAHGPMIQTQVVAALRTGETLYAGVTARIQATKADGTALAATLQAVGTDLAAGGHALDQAFDGLDSQDTSGKLTQAIAAEPACANVRS